MAIDYDPFDIQAQQQGQDERDRIEKIAKQFEVEDFKWLMEHAQGRRFIGRLIERAGLYRTSFTGDNDRTNFQEGIRNFGILLMSLINEHTPEKYFALIADIKARETEGK